MTMNFLDTRLPLFSNLTYKVKDMSEDTVRFGRKEMELALHEMPGLASLREEFAASQPLKGAPGSGSPPDHRPNRWAQGSSAGARRAPSMAMNSSPAPKPSTPARPAREAPRRGPHTKRTAY